MLLKEGGFFLKCSSVNRLCPSSVPGREGSGCKGPAAGLGHHWRDILGWWAQSHTLTGPTLYTYTGRWLLMATLFLECICITISTYQCAFRAGACILSGETGMCPEQMDPFAVKQTRSFFCQIRCPDFQLEKHMMNYSLSSTCASDGIFQSSFQDSFHCVMISAQWRELAVLSQETPLQRHSIVLTSRRSGYWSCVMRQGTIIQVTLGLFLAALRAARPRFSAVPCFVFFPLP